MAGYSDYLELKILDHLFGGASFAQPGTVYLALVTVAVTDADTGATITEATYTSYARKAVLAADWRAATSSGKKNLNQLDFAMATGGTSTVIGVAILDSATIGAGNVLAYGTVASTAISTNVIPSFATDAIIITQD